MNEIHIPIGSDVKIDVCTLPETDILAPENGWLEYDPFLVGLPIFRGYVSFRECNPNVG